MPNLDFLKNPGFQKYFSNTSWLMGERVLRMGVNILVGIYVARYLGPGRFGELSYAQSFVGLFSAIAMLGLDGIVIRELVKEPLRCDELLGTAFWLKFVGALVVLPMIWGGVQITDNTAEENLLVFIIAAGLLFQATNVIDFYFQSKVQSRYVVQAQFIQMVVSSLAKIALVLLAAPLTWFAVVVMVDSIVLAFGLTTIYSRKKLSIRKWRCRWKTVKMLLDASWPLILSGIAITIYMKIDQVMIKEMLSAEAVGNYAVAVRLSEAWYFLPIAITGSLYPAIINAKKKSEQNYLKRLQQLYDLMVGLAVGIAVPTTLFGDEIIYTLFGSAYVESGNVLTVHIWAGVFVFIGVANNRSLLTQNLQIQSMVRTLIGAVSNVILNLLLIPSYGILGAAVATIISYCISAYLSIPIFRGQWSNFIMASKSLCFLWLIRRLNEEHN